MIYLRPSPHKRSDPLIKLGPAGGSILVCAQTRQRME